jgi:GT2 family glycosyltransferase
MAREKLLNITVTIPTLCQEHTVARVIPTLRSLLNSSREMREIKLQIILFANGAADKTQRIFQKKLSKEFTNIHVIGSQLNKGFTGGVNESLIWSFGHLKTDWFVILNDDTNVKNNFFECFLTAVQQVSPDVISCAVENTAGNLESFGLDYFTTGLAFPAQTTKQKKDEKQHIFCGTCVWFSHQVVEQQLKELGYLFNPLYFAYAEDLECSLRLLMLKKHSILLPESLVVHQGSVTAGRSSFFQLYHGYRNLVLTIIVLWSTQHILKNTLTILFGQLYILLHTFYKGYWMLYPKVLWYIFKNRSELTMQRKIYEEQIGHLYTA